jgi:hypothetical protein
MASTFASFTSFFFNELTWNFLFYLVETSSSTWWASLALAPAGGDGDGSGAGPPCLFVVFDFVLIGSKNFDLARNVFDAVVGLDAAAHLAAGTAPVATTPACGTMCVPTRRR